jgi:hypothetical protein
MALSFINTDTDRNKYAIHMHLGIIAETRLLPCHQVRSQRTRLVVSSAVGPAHEKLCCFLMTVANLYGAYRFPVRLREGAHRGLATLCVGVGQGVALLVEAA